MVVGTHVSVTVRSEPDKVEKREYVIKASDIDSLSGQTRVDWQGLVEERED